MSRHLMMEFTCVYPQPGCNVEALPEAWRARAAMILADYKPNSSKYQGCCCDYGEHVRLDDERAAALRAARFIVENDSEDE